MSQTLLRYAQQFEADAQQFEADAQQFEADTQLEASMYCQINEVSPSRTLGPLKAKPH